jgi:hypothetical protein
MTERTTGRAVAVTGCITPNVALQCAHMPDNSETIALRDTEIGGHRQIDDFTVIWRDLHDRPDHEKQRRSLVVGLQL